MITCLLVLIDLRAMVVICRDCCSHSLLANRNTIWLLYRMMNGVASMESTMLASIGFSSAGGTKALV